MTLYLQTLDQAWPASSKIAEYAEHLAYAPAAGFNWAISILAFASLLYFIFFYNQIAQASALSLQSFFGSRTKLQSICENQTSLSAINLTSIICIPFIAILIYTKGWTSMQLLPLFIAMLAFLLIRVMLFRFVKWYKGGGAVFNTIRYYSKITLITATILSIPAFIISMFFGQANSDFALHYFITAFCLCFLLYCIMAFKYLLEADFSIFFCFLYLCALELLPAGLLIGAIVSL